MISIDSILLAIMLLYQISFLILSKEELLFIWVLMILKVMGICSKYI